MLYPTWYDPYHDRLCQIEDVLATLETRTHAWRAPLRQLQLGRIEGGLLFLCAFHDDGIGQARRLVCRTDAATKER